MGVSERMPRAAGAASGPFDLVVAGDRVLVDGAFIPAEVGVRDGGIVRIAPLGSGLAATRIVRLADDEVLIPGLVDTHVHVNEPGRTEWEGFASATRAAAAGGVTTIVDMPLNSIPPTTSVSALEVKRRAAEGAVFVDVGFWGGLVPDNLGDLGPLIDRGRVRVQVLPRGLGRRRSSRRSRPATWRRRCARSPRPTRSSSCTPRTPP